MVESTELWDSAWKDSIQNAVTAAENRPVLMNTVSIVINNRYHRIHTKVRIVSSSPFQASHISLSYLSTPFFNVSHEPSFGSSQK